MRHLAAALTVGALCCSGLSACGSGGVSSGGVSSGGVSRSARVARSAARGSRYLTIYSSLGLEGSSRADAITISNSILLAIEQAGGVVRGEALRYVSLDDASPATGAASAAYVSQNARAAAGDPTAIAYIGEQTSAATRISIPITNRARLLQVSVTNGYTGLTQLASGNLAGDPTDLYPTGLRTFGRLVPDDAVESHAAASYMQQLGCSSLVLVDDGSVDGDSLVALLATAAPADGIRVAGRAIRLDPANANSTVDAVESSHAACMFYGGGTVGAAGLFNGVSAGRPGMQLFGSDGVADSAFTQGLSTAAQTVTHVTAPEIDPDFAPESALDYSKAYLHRFGTVPEPCGAYAYAVAEAVLEAIDVSQSPTRAGVLTGFFSLRDVSSTVGTYSVTSTGDSSTTDYGGYSVAAGQLDFDRLLQG